jgi:hypothetical protein
VFTGSRIERISRQQFPRPIVSLFVIGADNSIVLMELFSSERKLGR